MSKGWIAVDFDGTLAYYDVYSDVLGEPIAPMVDRVKKWLGEGKLVKIFTARVADEDGRELVIANLETWSLKHLGQVIPITCQKDQHMVELWDDRAVQVIRNTGQIVGYSTRGHS